MDPRSSSSFFPTSSSSFSAAASSTTTKLSPPSVSATNPNSSVVQFRNRSERKFTSAAGEDSTRPQKSRSASDLLSFKIIRSSIAGFPTAPTTNNGAIISNTTTTAAANGDALPAGGSASSRKSVASTTNSNFPRHKTWMKLVEENAAASSTSSSSMPAMAVTMMDPADVNLVKAYANKAQQQSGSKLEHRERRFRRLFRSVPTTEALLCRYSCAYVSDAGLLLQGHLYISGNWICFHSNVFGIEKIIEIPALTVRAVSKSHTAKFIPNAVKVKTAEDRYYLFGSLLSRDNTYRLLVNVVSSAASAASDGNQQDQDQKDRNIIRADAGALDEEEEEDDDDSETGSSFTTETTTSSSNNYNNSPDEAGKMIIAGSSDAADNRKTDFLQRRFFDSSSSKVSPDDKKSASANHHSHHHQSKRRKSDFAKNTATRWLLPHLFFGLPKTLMILIVCVVLIMFLFTCATVLTIRLIYIRNSPAAADSFLNRVIPWGSAESYEEVFILSRQTLDNLDVLLDGTLKTMLEMKRSLDDVKRAIQNGLLVEPPITAVSSD